MHKAEIERFFDDFGTAINPDNGKVDPLYTPLHDEKAYVADWGSSPDKRQQRVYLIRVRAGDQCAVIRATTVVLRTDTLLCFHAWQSAKPAPELQEMGRNMNVDVTEVSYHDILALKLRCKALRVDEVNEMAPF